MSDNHIRCPWGNYNDQLKQYHDTEWGTVVHDDQMLFEFLMLDCFQAGLSWDIILKKRENFREAFDNFDIQKVAAYGSEQLEKHLANPGIVRNRAKLKALVVNANAVLQIQTEFGSFDRFLWNFTGSRTIQNAWKSMGEIPAKSPESEQMSAELRKRGFQFVGPTICYAVMQSIGMVNDHLVTCFRYLMIQ